MRIFLISNMFPSNKDPLFGVFVKNFKEELEKQGVIFIKSVLIRGKSYSKFKKLGSYLNHYWHILVAFFSKDYDIVYIHYLTHHIPILFLILPMKTKPIVINVHGSDLNSLIHSPGLRYFGQIILKRIDLLVVPTKEYANIVIRTFPFMDENKIAISPSGGIDGRQFYPLNHHTSSDILTLGFISRFTLEKGWRTFLDTLVLLKNEQIPFRAIIGGKGPDEQLILSYIDQKGLKEFIDFRGFIHQEELYKVYNELSVYIFPTYRDSLGLTGLEAMSCGIPVIASNIEGGPSSYVINGVNGYLFEPKNVLDLSKKIKLFNALIEDQKKKMVLNALQMSKKYSKDVVAHNLIIRLRSVI